MPTESSDPESLLAQALEQLSRRWMQTSAGWSDKAREDFEKEYVDEFRQGVKRSLHAMRNVTMLLKQIRKDCSDNG